MRSISRFEVKVQGILFRRTFTVEGSTKEEARRVVRNIEGCPWSCVMPSPKRIKLLHRCSR